MPKILFHVSRLHEFDATSVDLCREADGLSQRGYEVHIHATNYPEKLKNKVIDTIDALRLAGEPTTLVIVHYGGLDRNLGRILRATAGKFILRYHNITPPKWFRSIAWKSYLHALLGQIQIRSLIRNRKVDLLLPASQFSAQELLSPFPKDRHPPVEIIPALADYNSFRTAGNRQKNSGPRRNALFVSRILPHKGLIHLLELLKAWPESDAAKTGISLHITVAGKLDPPYQNYFRFIQQKVAELKVGNQITFRTDVSHEDLFQLYQNADIYICPSEHEGFGVPTVEAQCAGLPVVALDCGAVREVIGPGGIFVPRHSIDYHAFAKAVGSVLTDKDLYHQLSEAALENTRRFDDNRVITQFTEALEKISPSV